MASLPLFALFLILEKLFLGEVLESVPIVFGRVYTLASGRRYIGIELLEQYHRAGQQRLAAVQRAMQQGAANDDWFMPEAA